MSSERFVFKVIVYTSGLTADLLARDIRELSCVEEVAPLRLGRPKVGVQVLAVKGLRKNAVRQQIRQALRPHDVTFKTVPIK